MAWGIQTVYIPRENLRFLEEWLAYHTMLGAEHFYMYDNTGSRDLHLDNAIAVTGRNKYGLEMDFSLSDDEILEIEAQIFRRYPVTKVIWQPRDGDRIIHGHVEAVDHFALNTSIDWCAFIDIDEFIYSPHPIADLLHGKVLTMLQKKFDDRFGYDRALDITATFPVDTRAWGGKRFIEMQHYVPGGRNIHHLNVDRMGVDIAGNFERIHFHHYNHNRTGHQWLLDYRDRIDPNWLPVPYEAVFTDT